MKLGGSKMKTINMIKIVPMVLLGFALSVQAQGDFKVTRVSQGNSQPVVFSLDYPVIKSGAPTIVKAETFFQADRVIELEGWMFNDNYLQADASNQVEAWMTDKDYLDSESPNPVENWMMDSKYLDNETVLPVESWMLNDSYLTKR
jgi:hypothetical protein